MSIETKSPEKADVSFISRSRQAVFGLTYTIRGSGKVFNWIVLPDMAPKHTERTPLNT